MRFLVDAQLPPALAAYLEASGHQAEHVNRIGLGSASDLEVWRHAGAVRATLITKDIDFLALSQRNDDHPAVVWIRLGNCTNAALTAVVDALLPEIVSALTAGERLVEVR